MEVLDQDQRRPHDGRAEEIDDRGSESTRLEDLVEPLGLGRRVDVGVDRDRDERKPREQMRGEDFDGVTQNVTARQAAERSVDAGRLADELADDRVRDRRPVLVGRDGEDTLIADVPPQLVDQSRLAHARLGGDLDQAPTPGRSQGEGVEQRSELAVTPEERDLRARLRIPCTQRRPDRERFDRLTLPLDSEGREFGGGEHRARALDDLGRRDDLSRLGFRGQPSGEVDRVAHDRILLSVRGTDQTGEDRALVDADPNRDRMIRLHDLANGAEQLFSVVLAPPGRARSEHELAAVRLGVAIQERDEVPCGGRLDDLHQPAEALRRHSGALPIDDRVEPVEPNERDRDAAMLGVDPRRCEASDLRSEERRGIHIGGDERVDLGQRHRRHANEEPASVLERRPAPRPAGTPPSRRSP